MHPFGSVFSHMGCRSAANQFGKSLMGLGIVQGDSITAQKSPVIQESQGPSSSGTMTLPLLGDVSNVVNVLSSGIDLFAKYNLAKSGGMKVTEPGGKDTPSLPSASSPMSLGGIIPIAGLAIGAVVLYFIFKK
jgi:hypothetical protein